MSDLVFERFLEEQLKCGMKLAGQSDLLDLAPVDRDRYIARFHCKGLIRSNGGEIIEASNFHVGIWFPSDYLREVDPLIILTWLYPLNAWHPNIRPPAICAGRIVPGTELVDLLYQCFEIITYNNWAAHDPLNREASQWARNHQARFPIDRRPLKRRQLELTVRAASEDSDRIMSTSFTTYEMPIANLLEQYSATVKADGPNRRECELDGTPPLRVRAQWDEDWLLLRAQPGGRGLTARPSPRQLGNLLQENGLPSGVKFGLAGEPPWVRLLADIPIEEDTELRPRLVEALDGFRRGAARFDGTGESDSVASEASQAAQDARAAQDAVDPAELCGAAGWPFTDRADGLMVPLDVPDAFYQAAVSTVDVGLRLAFELGKLEAVSATSRTAIDVFLLIACSVVRMARARTVQTTGETKYLWEIMLGNAPSAGEVGHALASLSVACRVSAREFQALQDETIAGHYLTERDWVLSLGERSSHNHKEQRIDGSNDQ